MNLLGLAMSPAVAVLRIVDNLVTAGSLENASEAKTRSAMRVAAYDALKVTDELRTFPYSA